MSRVLYRLLPYYGELDKDVQHNLKIDGLAALIFGFFAGAIYPFTSIIAVRLGASDLLIGLLSTAPFFGQLFAIYWGYHSSISPRKVPIVFWAGLLSRLLVIPLAFFTSPAVFVFLVIFHYMISTIYNPAYNGLLKKIYPDQYRGRLMGTVKLLLGITHVGATYLAGWWIDTLGFKGIFIIGGIVGVLASIVFIRIKEEASGQAEIKPERFSFRKIYGIFIQDKALILCMLGFTIFGFGNLVASPAYPIYQVKVLELTNSQIALLSVFNMPVWFLTYPLWGWIHDRTRSMVNIYIGIVLYGLAPLIYLIYPSFWALVLASCLQGAAGASQDVGYINQMLKMGGKNADHYMGIYGTFLGARGILAPIVGSMLISNIGFQGVFILAACLIFAGLIPMSMVERKMGKMSAGA